MRRFLLRGLVFFRSLIVEKKSKFFSGFDSNYHFFKLERKLEGRPRKMIDASFPKMLSLPVESAPGKGVRMKYLFIWGHLRWGYLRITSVT